MDLEIYILAECLVSPYVKAYLMILYVENDRDDCEFFAEALAAIRSDIPLDFCSDGQEAIAFLHTRKFSGVYPCLIILDLNMPKMDGRKAVEEIKKDPDFAEIPLIIFTTGLTESDRSFLQSQNVEVFIKPNKLVDLINAVEEILNRYFDCKG